MTRIMITAIALSLFAGIANAGDHIKDRSSSRAKDRACTAADVARFEAMLGGIRKGEYRTDPRFADTVHYLGTAIVNGTCNVALRPAE